jgi:hypothetical protein
VFASYSIYKGKAALAFDPRPPQFVPLEVGRLWCGMLLLLLLLLRFLLSLLMGLPCIAVWGAQGGEGGVRAAPVRPRRGGPAVRLVS